MLISVIKTDLSVFKPSVLELSRITELHTPRLRDRKPKCSFFYFLLQPKSVGLVKYHQDTVRVAPATKSIECSNFRCGVWRFSLLLGLRWDFSAPRFVVDSTKIKKKKFTMTLSRRFYQHSSLSKSFDSHRTRRNHQWCNFAQLPSNSR